MRTVPLMTAAIVALSGVAPIAMAQRADYRFSLAPSASSALGFVSPADRDFVEVVAEARGDLNGDGRSDLAVIVGVRREVWDELVDQGDADVLADQQPVFFVALSASGGRFTRTVTSVKLLGCYSCGGAFSGFTPLFDLAISRASVRVSQQSGAREVVGRTHTFRLTKRPVRAQLIGYDEELVDRLGPSICAESFNLLTKRVVIEREADGTTEPIIRGTFAPARSLITLTDVERTPTDRLLTNVSSSVRCSS